MSKARVIGPFLLGLLILLGVWLPEGALPVRVHLLVAGAAIWALGATAARVAGILLPEVGWLARAVIAFEVAVAVVVVPATWLGHFGHLSPRTLLFWVVVAFLLTRLFAAPAQASGVASSISIGVIPSRLEKGERLVVGNGASNAEERGPDDIVGRTIGESSLDPVRQPEQVVRVVDVSGGRPAFDRRPRRVHPIPRDLPHERADQVFELEAGQDRVEKGRTVLESPAQDPQVKPFALLVDLASQEEACGLAHERGVSGAVPPFLQRTELAPDSASSLAHQARPLLGIFEAQAREERGEDRRVVVAPSEGHARGAGHAATGHDPVVMGLLAPLLDDRKVGSVKEASSLRGRKPHPLVRVRWTVPDSLPPAVDLEPEETALMQAAGDLSDVGLDRVPIGNVLEHDEREGKIERVARDGSEGAVRDLHLDVFPPRAVLPRLLDHHRRNIDAADSRDPLRQGDEQPPDTAPDLEADSGWVEVDPVQDHGLEISSS
jgi:hypothetical protein